MKVNSIFKSSFKLRWIFFISSISHEYRLDMIWHPNVLQKSSITQIFTWNIEFTSSTATISFIYIVCMEKHFLKIENHNKLYKQFFFLFLYFSECYQNLIFQIFSICCIRQKLPQEKQKISKKFKQYREGKILENIQEILN